MLSERPRNVIVGLTLIISLAVLMYGIVLLGKFPEFGALRPYNVMLTANNAAGITPGSQVQLNGVYAGQVTAVSLATDATGKLVAHVVLQIEHDKRIPQSARAILKQPQAVGNPVVAIEVSDTTGPMLPQDGSAMLTAEQGDTGLIPREIFVDIHNLTDRLSTLSKELTTVAGDLHVMLVYAPPELIEKQDPNDPNRLRENASTVVIRLNRTVKSLQDLLTDPALQAKVRTTMQNFEDASAQLKATMAKADGVVTKVDGVLTRVDGVVASTDITIKAAGGAATQASATLETTQREIVRVSQKLVETMAQIEKSSRDLTEGKGTTGRLVSDPRLFDGLLDLSKSLKSTVDDLDFLMKKWKDEGVDLHLGK